MKNLIKNITTCFNYLTNMSNNKIKPLFNIVVTTFRNEKKERKPI